MRHKINSPAFWGRGVHVAINALSLTARQYANIIKIVNKKQKIISKC